MRSDAPADLLRSWADGDVTVFVGAGASVGSGLPTWSELVELLTQELGDTPVGADLPMLARYYELAFGRRRLVQVLTDALSSGEPNAIHRGIASLHPRTLVTTNFDDLLEQALQLERVKFTCIRSDDEAPLASSRTVSVIKLHGDLARPQSLIVTTRDFELFESSRPAMARLLATTLQTRTILFVGYSATDPNLRLILRKVHGETGEHYRRLYMLAFRPSDLERLELSSRGIEVIDLGPEDQGDRTVRTAQWLDRFRNEIESGTDAANPSQLIRGKTARTELIVKSLQDMAVNGPPDAVVRLRQGFSSLSLGNNDHADDPEYSRLLQSEREAVHELLSRGREVRLIIGRRPIFASDLTSRSAAQTALARRLLDRAQRMLATIDGFLARDVSPRLLLAVSTATHFADLSLGDHALFRGVRSDSSAGYDVTVLEKDRRQVSEFNQAFDQEFTDITGVEINASIANDEVRRLMVAASQEIRLSADLLSTWLLEGEDGDHCTE